MSILAVYENRYALLRDNKQWNKFRKPYIIVNYILILLCFVYPVYQVPDQAQAQQYLLKEYPCILEKSGLDQNSVFVMSYGAVNVAGPMIIEATICFSQLFVFAILTYKFFWKKRAGVSSKTFEMQRKFIVALFVQTIMVLVILIIPLYLFMLSAFSNRYDQVTGLNNLCIIIFSMNATISTTAMILLHPPYRQFTIFIFTRPFIKCYEAQSSLHSGIWNERF
ncbi:hypothetical protein CAEBREN_11954 [Caenorhabditis brenneri]|uniref:Uncharacterized protein n=1 Tax=Caenorhabditis brenneri TaxID=135651 RepID=G0M9G9_CAEBE|nr:hypothetical protein CAEBREN_11954 [Caenorhabditis brenneri]